MTTNVWVEQVSDLNKKNTCVMDKRATSQSENDFSCEKCREVKGVPAIQKAIHLNKFNECKSKANGQRLNLD